MAKAVTAEAESAQALFCALVDFTITNDKTPLNSKEFEVIFDVNVFDNFDIFKQAWNVNHTKDQSIENLYSKFKVSSTKLVNTGSTTYAQVEKLLLGDKSWYKSSVLIAVKLMKDMTTILSKYKVTKPNWDDIFYARGDKEIMDNISDLFSLANKNQKSKNDLSKRNISLPFSNINKWSPADIYYASTNAKTEIQKKVTEQKSAKNIDIDELNIFINELIQNGELLPLSLKKSTTEVKIEAVNFDRQEELDKLKKIKYKSYEFTPMSKNAKPGDKTPARDLKVFFGDGKDSLVFRHDPSGTSEGSIRGDIDIKGMDARGGGLGEGPIGKILGFWDSSIEQEYKAAVETGKRQFAKHQKPLDKKLEDELETYSKINRINPPLKRSEKDKTRDEHVQKVRKKINFDEQRGIYSGVYVTNIVWPVIIKFLTLKDSKGKPLYADSFTRLIYAYAGARQEKSGRYVVAK